MQIWKSFKKNEAQPPSLFLCRFTVVVVSSTKAFYTLIFFPAMVSIPAELNQMPLVSICCCPYIKGLCQLRTVDHFWAKMLKKTSKD